MIEKHTTLRDLMDAYQKRFRNEVIGAILKRGCDEEIRLMSPGLLLSDILRENDVLCFEMETEPFNDASGKCSQCRVVDADCVLLPGCRACARCTVARFRCDRPSPASAFSAAGRSGAKPRGGRAGGVAAASTADTISSHSDADIPRIEDSWLPPAPPECPPMSARVGNIHDIRGVHACYRKLNRLFYLCHTLSGSPAWISATGLPDQCRYAFLMARRSVSVEDMINVALDKPPGSTVRGEGMKLQQELPQGWTPASFYPTAPT